MIVDDATANAILDAIGTSIGASPYLTMYAGDLPALTSGAHGTAIAEGQLPATPYASAGSPTARQKTKNGSWTVTGLPAAAGGADIRHFVQQDSTKTYKRAAGLVSMPWAASTPTRVGQQMHNGGNVYQCTAAGVTAGSGGPTGTGSGIVDGGATWKYMGPVEMTMDNTLVAQSQVATASSYALTYA